MELTINRQKKEIKIVYPVNLKDLLEELDYLFPDNSWMEYQLVYADSFQYPIMPTPYYPQTSLQPYSITTSTGTCFHTHQSGTGITYINTTTK